LVKDVAGLAAYFHGRTWSSDFHVSQLALLKCLQCGRSSSHQKTFQRSLGTDRLPCRKATSASPLPYRRLVIKLSNICVPINCVKSHAYRIVDFQCIPWNGTQHPGSFVVLRREHQILSVVAQQICTKESKGFLDRIHPTAGEHFVCLRSKPCYRIHITKPNSPFPASFPFRTFFEILPA
jgi:hypothetical protein